MNYWWVNHKQTFKQEFGNGYVWCPKRKQNGSRNHFYETLREICVGDIVFSYANAAIQGFGFAKTTCYSCPRPDDFGKIGDNWGILGWRADVSFQKFKKPIRTADHSERIAPLLPNKYSPIKPNGFGNQGAYFSQISEELGTLIFKLADQSDYQQTTDSTVAGIHAQSNEKIPIISEWEDRQQLLLENNDSLGTTTREALIKSRRGQGLFRSKIIQVEPYCRITKVNNPTQVKRVGPIILNL